MIKLLHTVGFRAAPLRVGSIGSILLCLSMWIRAKTIDQSARGNAERRAIFVGLWPPTLWLLADSLEEHEARQSSFWRW
jgi:hypothetical protein